MQGVEDLLFTDETNLLVTDLWLTTGPIQDAQRKTVSAALIRARMEDPAGKPLAPTYVPATLDGVAKTAQKVCTP